LLVDWVYWYSLSIVNIIVYAGAIMVLFLFVIMMFNLNEDTEPQKNNVMKLIGVIVGGLGILVFTASLKTTEQLSDITVINPEIGLVQNLGMVLFNDYLLPFEIISILFLSAMVGAVLLARKEVE